MIDVRDVIKKEIQRQWGVFFKRLTMLLRRLFKVPLDGISNLTINAGEVDYVMRTAKVTISWVPSPSDDVVSQHIKVVDPDDGQIFYDDNVGKEVTSVVLPQSVSEKQKLQVVVVVTDGVNQSDPVVVDWTVPDLTKPAPVSNLAFSYEVVDVEENSATEEEGAGN